MKKLQRILIVIIILLPVILGLVFLAGAPARITPSASFKRLGLVRIEGIILNSESIVKQLSAFRTDRVLREYW